MKRSKTSTLIRLIAGFLPFLFSFVISLLLYMPWLTGPCGQESDSSSDMVLHVAFATHMSFGREIIWPFGPYGFMYGRSYHPHTYHISLALWAFCAATLVSSLWVSIGAGIHNSWLNLPLTIAMLLAGMLTLDTVFLVLPFLLLLHHFYPCGRSSTILVVLLACACALASLVKFTFFAVAVTVVFATAVDDILRKRKLPLASIAFTVAVAAFWLLAHQDYRDFWPFVTQRLAISSGYAAAMSSWGPRREIAYVILASSLFYLFACYADWHIKRGRVSMFMAGLAGALLLVFRAGFVRHDEHALITTSVLFMITLIHVVRVYPALGRLGPRLVGILCMAAATALSWWSLSAHSSEGLPQRLGSTALSIGDRAHAIVRLIHAPAHLYEDYQSNAEEIKKTYPLPLVPCSADIYPHGQTSLILHGLHYAPRPIIQSYVTYTDRLAEINASHLRGNSAADFIFFRVWPIDERFPSLDDGLSWPELLARYDVNALSPDYVLLHRRQAPRSLRFVELGKVQTSLNSALDVPEFPPGVVWAKIFLRPTIAGRLASVLFKPAPVYIDVQTREPSDRRYAIIPMLARGGFLLSPLVESHESFAKLFTPDGRADLDRMRVSTMTVTDLDWKGTFYHQQITIEFYGLEVGPPEP